jgi:hypothetical protein
MHVHPEGFDVHASAPIILQFFFEKNTSSNLLLIFFSQG